MSAKKAAKKAAKKTAKKAAKHPTHDLRRAFEHLGRIEALQSGLPQQPARNVSLLASLAQQRLAAGQAQSAADLLRAAEHLSFAALASAAASRVSSDLQAGIRVTVDDLLSRAAQTKAGGVLTPSSVAQLYAETAHQARTALAASAWRQALELARAAEALAQSGKHGPARLPASESSPRRILGPR